MYFNQSKAQCSELDFQGKFLPSPLCTCSVIRYILLLVVFVYGYNEDEDVDRLLILRLARSGRVSRKPQVLIERYNSKLLISPQLEIYKVKIHGAWTTLQFEPWAEVKDLVSN